MLLLKDIVLFVCLFKPLYLLSQMMQVVTINERSLRSKAIRFFLWGPPGVLGIWGEGLFIFRELGSTAYYFRGAGEQAHTFRDLGSNAKK